MELEMEPVALEMAVGLPVWLPEIEPESGIGLWVPAFCSEPGLESVTELNLWWSCR